MVDTAQYVAQTFKEYKYYNSHNLHLEEVLCGVCRIEFPSTIDVTEDIAEDIYITAYITANQIPVHEYPISTNFAVKDRTRNSLTWEYVLSFPVKFRELPRNAMLLLTAWMPSGAPLGGTCVTFFDESGCLRRGKQKLLFYLNTVADTHVVNNATPGEAYYADKLHRFSRWDFMFQMEKHLEVYRCQQQSSGAVKNSQQQQLQQGQGQGQGQDEGSTTDWLDRLTLAQIQYALGNVVRPTGTAEDGARRMTPDDVQSTSKDAFYFGCCDEEAELHARCWMVVELPLFLHPVVHDEKPYPTSSTALLGIMNAGSAGTGAGAGGGTAGTTAPSSGYGVGGTAPSATSYVTETERGIFDFTIAGKDFSPLVMTFTKDWELEQENIFEEQHRRLERDVHRGAGGAGAGSAAMIKPNLKEKEVIDRILGSTTNHLEFAEKDLLYRFRYTLTENKRALTKFLLSVDWTSEAEVNEIPALLNLWRTKAPIDISDALKLLGREKAFQRKVVREYAVEVLKTASDDQLRMFLSQLVQALRYDAAMQQMAANGSNSGDVAALQQPQAQAPAHASAPSADGGSNNKLSSLANFLIERACASASLANFLYWYLKVETEDDTGLGPMFTAVLNAFLSSLKSSQAGKGGAMTARLMASDEYVAEIIKCQRLGREDKGRKEMKEQCFRRNMEQRKLHKVADEVGWLPMPLDPGIKVTGQNIASSFMFTSALYPAVIEFTTRGAESGGVTLPPAPPAAAAESADATPPAPPTPAGPTAGPTCRVIFKTGDDLRQDQLIMQMFNLMDTLLKNVNLDLKLLTYGILATGPTDGLMEFVGGSIAVSAIMKQFNGSIASYLKHHHPDPNEPLGISAACMDTYVKSCAGSCVISYILGIGDRHLDNVMMCSTGQLFHIDFGFIFGRDPKPYPPPFRFTRAMVDAMGGDDSEHYAKFKTLCCQAYSWLRKSANLILSLLSLMGDAGIPDMSIHSDLPTVLAKVEDRFRLDLTDEQAEQYFLELIVQTINAIAPRLMELAHQFAVARR